MDLVSIESPIKHLQNISEFNNIFTQSQKHIIKKKRIRLTSKRPVINTIIFVTYSHSDAY